MRGSLCAASHFAFLCFEVLSAPACLAVRGYATPAAPERALLCCLALHRLCIAILQHPASNVRHFWDEADISAVSDRVESLRVVQKHGQEVLTTACLSDWQIFILIAAHASEVQY